MFSPSTAAELIEARVDRLPATRHIWMIVVLISLGGWFEIYDLFFTAYIAPGLVASGMLSTTTTGFFGLNGMAAFVAATFAGVFVGTFFFGGLSDRYGRRTVFIYSLIWYTISTAIMAAQTGVAGLLAWRLIAGIGVGVQVVSMDAYIAEMVPRRIRGRAFALNHAVQFTAVPFVALLSWLLVPHAPFGIAGWRWVVLIGSVGTVAVWLTRHRLPESPRWLASRSRLGEADVMLAKIERVVERQCGRPLSVPAASQAPMREQQVRGHVGDLLQPGIRGTFIVLVVFSIFQNFGYYGFAQWVPTLIVAKGVTVTKSLFYAFAIAFAYPIGPMIALNFADRMERKWVIVLCAFAVCVVGTAFYFLTSPVLIILCGIAMTLVNTVMAYSYHAYQVEVFPARIRARAAGLAYSASRLAGIFSGFVIAFALREHGLGGVFTLISAAMVIVMLVIGIFGPRVGSADPATSH